MAARWRPLAALLAALAVTCGLSAPALGAGVRQMHRLTQQYRGGVVEPFLDRPDPYILWDRSAHVYRMYTTVTLLGNIPEWTATDLAGPWHYVGNALPALPSWATAFSTWAPEVRKIDGKWTLWASAQNQQTVPCLFRATAASPRGPFTVDPHRLACDAAGRMDPTTVLVHGQWWIAWKTNGYALTPVQPDTFVSQRLGKNGLPIGHEHVLMTSNHPWAEPQIEAPSFVQNPQGRWWLIFSGGTVTPTDPTYQIYRIPCSGLAACDSRKATIIVRHTATQQAPGEQSVFHNSRGQVWIAYNPDSYFINSDDRPLTLFPVRFTARNAPICAST